MVTCLKALKAAAQAEAKQEIAKAAVTQPPFKAGNIILIGGSTLAIVVRDSLRDAFNLKWTISVDKWAAVGLLNGDAYGSEESVPSLWELLAPSIKVYIAQQQAIALSEVE